MKRARAGSISGRLRSASDLEEKGLIDKSQKGVLKDLIISGDSELQTALDLYDRGDTSKLEGESAAIVRGILICLHIHADKCECERTDHQYKYTFLGWISLRENSFVFIFRCLGTAKHE